MLPRTKNKKNANTKLKIVIAVLYIFSVWSVFIFWLRASGYIDANWLAFNLDTTHFWNRGFIYLAMISTWYVYSGRKKIYRSETERDLSFVFLLLSIGLDNLGNLLGWYRTDTPYGIAWYDKVVHFIDSGLLAGFFIITFRNVFRKALYSHILIAAVLASIAAGSLFEVVEYLSDLWTDTRLVSGIQDTALDSLMNVAGAITVVILARIPSP